MMTSRSGVIILVVGLGLLVVALFADSLGIGDHVGFGREQTLGIAAGLVITALGLLLTFRKRRGKD